MSTDDYKKIKSNHPNFATKRHIKHKGRSYKLKIFAPFVPSVAKKRLFRISQRLLYHSHRRLDAPDRLFPAHHLDDIINAGAYGPAGQGDTHGLGDLSELDAFLRHEVDRKSTRLNSSHQLI